MTSYIHEEEKNEDVHTYVMMKLEATSNTHNKQYRQTTSLGRREQVKLEMCNGATHFMFLKLVQDEVVDDEPLLFPPSRPRGMTE